MKSSNEFTFSVQFYIFMRPFTHTKSPWVWKWGGKKKYSTQHWEKNLHFRFALFPLKTYGKKRILFTFQIIDPWWWRMKWTELKWSRNLLHNQEPINGQNIIDRYFPSIEIIFEAVIINCALYEAIKARWVNQSRYQILVAFRCRVLWDTYKVTCGE